MIERRRKNQGPDFLCLNQGLNHRWERHLIQKHSSESTVIIACIYIYIYINLISYVLHTLSMLIIADQMINILHLMTPQIARWACMITTKRILPSEPYPWMYTINTRVL